MKFLFMICEEYHDEYSNHCIIEATGFDAVDLDTYDYGMRGYPAAYAVAGPVHPYMYMRNGVTVWRGLNDPETKFVTPTLGDLIRKQMEG